MTPLDFPNRITLELTNACNLSCGFCPRHLMEKNLGYMDEELFIKAIDEMAENLPVALVPFFRGEPLLHPKFLRLIKYAKERGVGPIQLTTNGMLLDEEKAAGLVDSGVDFVSFSLDTVDAEEYEKNRPGANYERVTANVERFIKMRNAAGRGAPQVQVSSVATEIFRKSKAEFVEKWIGKADRVRIYAEHSKDGRFGSLELGASGSLQERLPCKKVMTDMVIYWDGDVALCNHDWDRQLPVGNIQFDSIRRIWHGARYQQIREEHTSGKVQDATCSGCDHWKMYYIPEGFVGEVYDGVGKTGTSGAGVEEA
ncbi:MAG: radical SAM protein [Nitrospinota bacterium]|nr:radical SAM protein [Nitrospinota bacterium]